MQRLQALILIFGLCSLVAEAEARREKITGRVRLEGSRFVVVGEGKKGLPRRIRVKLKPYQGFELVALEGRTLKAEFELTGDGGELLSYVPQND